MYEDCIIKKNVLAQNECNDLAEKLIELSKQDNAKKVMRGYAYNRHQIPAITYFNNKRTSLYPLLAPYRERLAEVFNLKNIDGLSLGQVFDAPCDLPMHVDPPVINYTRLIALLRKPPTGGDVVLSEKAFSPKTILALEVGDVYLLPAHKYFHGVTFFQEGHRVTLGFDYKKETNG